MLPLLSKPLRLLAWGGVLAVGCAVGWLSYHHTQDAWLIELQANAARCALAIDDVAVASLDGTPADLKRPEYQRVGLRLEQLRTVHPTVRRVSVFRTSSDSDELRLLAHAGSASPVLPESRAVNKIDALTRALLIDGRACAERPTRDISGIYVTGYAPVGRPRAAGFKTIQDILVLEVDAHNWSRGLWDAAAHSALYVLLILGTPVALFVMRGRQDQKVLENIADHERRQEQLRAAKEEAEAGDRAKGQFLATMSHEVRTPVHGIVGFTNLLLETPLTPEQREYVQTIRSSGEALVQLTGDILDFSKIETGKLQLEASACDLRVTIEDALDIFAARAAQQGVELLHWVDPDVPMQVILDGGRLRQVLVNLIGNGIKFTPCGEVEVTVRMLTGKGASLAPFDLTHSAGQMVAEFEDGSLTLEFAVRDTGIGVSATDRPKLFQPFTQLDASTVRRYGGAGLGLAISRNLVRLMSGDIWLESEPGRGSTFYFTVRGRPPPRSELVDAPSVDLSRRRIAVVTPTPRLGQELGALLRQCGASVNVLSWTEFLAHTWDFAIVDCVPEVQAQLQEQARDSGWRSERIFGLVPVIVSSSERHCLRPHLRVLINKPVHHRTLLGLLARASAAPVVTNAEKTS